MFRERGRAISVGLAAYGLGVLLASCGGGSGGSDETSATLTWSAPTTQADGSTPLTELTGYRVHYGTASRQYAHTIDVGNVTTYSVNHLAAGTYYFAVTAYNSGGESDYSVEGSKTIR